MPKRFGLIAAVCALSAAGLAAAQSAQPLPTSPETYVAARQASFGLSAATFGGLKAALDAGQTPKSQAFQAKALARWAKTLPTLFPEGSTTAASKALPAVWSDRAGFDKAAAGYVEATAKLQAAAEADDKAAFEAVWAQTREACGTCHKSYRAASGRS
jgi:cytochrome c556